MKKLITETFVLSKTDPLFTKNGKEFFCIYVDPQKSTDVTLNNKANQDLLKSYGMVWFPSCKYTYGVKDVPQAWGWPIFKGKESEKYPLVNRFSKEIIEKETPMDDGNRRKYEEVLADIGEELASLISNSNDFPDGDKILRHAEEYKEMLAKGIGSKETMDALARLVQYRRELEKCGEQNYSWLNTLLIMMQKKGATDVRARGTWIDAGYTINEGATPIILSMPKAFGYFKGSMAAAIIDDYLKEVGVNKRKELNAFQERQLRKKLSYPIKSAGFKPYIAYDISDTTPGPNAVPTRPKQKLEEVFQWFAKLEPTEKETVLINACIAYGKSIGVKAYYFVPKEELGTSRGTASSNGIVRVIDDEKDLGVLSTTIHETAHQIMHWTVIKNATKSMERFYRGGSAERGTQIIEQEAELTAWVVLTGFGYKDLQTHFNYLSNWGMNVKNCSDVFDGIMKVANEIHKGMLKNINQEDITKFNFDA
jgi:hypothetical protein